MKTQTKTIKLLAALIAGSLLAACGSGTSKSSADSAGSEGNSDTTQKQPEVDLAPVEITRSNYSQVASQSLKSLLLNDAGANALNRSVTVTGTHQGELANVATGIVLELDYPCFDGGNLKFRADVKDSNGDAQINFGDQVTANFHTTFERCVQTGSELHGQVVLDMEGNLGEWLNGGSYSVSANVATDDLLVKQVNMPTFNFEGDFTYNVSSADGVSVVTEMTSSNSYYIADMDYQMLDFHVVKEVDNNTGAYSYHLNSEFTDFYNQNTMVQYRTIEALTGEGFALPSAGSLMISGLDSNIMVYVEENEVLRLELDLDNDGTVDEESYTNWNDLVLNAFNNVQF